MKIFIYRNEINNNLKIGITINSAMSVKRKRKEENLLSYKVLIIDSKQALTGIPKCFFRARYFLFACYDSEGSIF